MFNRIKKKLAYFIIRRKYLKKTDPICFNKIISNSKDILIILPKEDKDFYHSLIFIKYYLIHKKRITLFLPAHKYNLIPEKEKYRYISFLPPQVTRLFLPDKSLIELLKEKNYDVLLDLNRSDDIFYYAVVSIIDAKLKVGYLKDNSETYYNLIFTNHTYEPEVSYRNLLNLLQMF